MSRVIELIEKYGGRRRVLPPADALLKAVQAKAGFDFPADYLDYLMNFQAFDGEVKEEWVRLWDAENLIEYNEENGLFESEDLVNTFAIGANAGGEFLGIEKLEKGDFRVVISPLFDKSNEYHIKIGTSFVDFLIRLDEGKEWFE